MNANGVYNGKGYGGKGPLRHVKIHDTWVRYANPRVLSGTLTYNTTTLQLLGNRISFNRAGGSQTVYVYHSFEYIDDQGEHYHGRWYNTEIPLQLIQTLPNNTFTYICRDYELNEEDYEDNNNRYVDATFTLILAPKFAQQVISLAAQP